MCGASSGSASSSLADLLDDPLHLVEVGVVGQPQRDLVDHPVARIVGDLLERAERHRMQVAAVVAQLDRAQREALDRAADAAALDVLADPEGIVEQEEDARDHVLDQRLRAEADRDADHAGAGDQRPDLRCPAPRAPSAPPSRASTTSSTLRAIGSSVRTRARRCCASGVSAAVPAVGARRGCGRSRCAAACQSSSTTSRITTACSTPRSSRDSVVSPAIELTSTSQSQASSERGADDPERAQAALQEHGRERRHGLGGVRAGRAQDVRDGPIA